MQTVVKKICVGLLMAASVGLVQAQESRQGQPYFAFGVGGFFIEETEIEEVPFTFGPAFQDVEIEFDPGVRFWLAGGYNFTDDLAAEIEVGFTYNPIKDFEVTRTTLIPGGTIVDTISGSDWNAYTIPILANVKYSLPVNFPLKPFIGGGAGGIWAFVDTGSAEEAFAFAYQGLGGLRYEFSPTADVSLIYKYLGTTDLEFDDTDVDGISSHTIGVEFSFHF